MITEGNIRCARCSMVVLDVFNVIMQELMQHQPISAPELYQKIIKDRNFRWNKLNSKEMHAIQTLRDDGFSKLDFSIIYKIARHFKGLIPLPTRNWGSNPQLQEISIGDDVERIHIKRNTFVHKVDAEITDEEMSDFFVTSIEIGRRIDNELNKAGDGGYEQKIQYYQSCSMDVETTEKKLQALQEIESLKKTKTEEVGDKKMNFFLGRSIAHVMKESVNGGSMTAVTLIFLDVKDADNLIEQLNKLKLENNLDTENIKFNHATQKCIAVSVLIRNTALVNSSCLLSEVNLFVQKMVASIGMMFVLEKDLNIVLVSSEDDGAAVFDYKEPDEKKRRVEIHQEDKKESGGGVDTTELRIVLLGKTGTGKSVTGNTILGSPKFESKAGGDSITKKCHLGINTRFDHKIVIVDTPGLYDTEMTNEQVIKEIVKCIGMTAPGPHAILLTLNVLRYTRDERDTVKHIVDYFGEGIFKYLIVVFTRVDELEYDDVDFGDYIKKIPESLKEILNLCDNRYIPFNNRLSGNDQEHQVKRLIDSVDEVVRKNGGVYYTNEMYKEAEKTLQRREDEVKRKLKEEEQRNIEALENECKEKVTLAENEMKKLEDKIEKIEGDKHRAENREAETKKAIDDQLAKFRKERDDNHRKNEEMRKENERLVQKEKQRKRQEESTLRDNSRKGIEKEDKDSVMSQIMTGVTGATRLFSRAVNRCSTM